MKNVIFKQASMFNPEVFSITQDIKYPIVFQDAYTVFAEDNNGKRVGIAKYADPLVVEILNDSDEVVNQPFPVEEPQGE